MDAEKLYEELEQMMSDAKSLLYFLDCRMDADGSINVKGEENTLKMHTDILLVEFERLKECITKK